MSRKAIETLKAHFKDDLSKEDWKLVVKLKKQRESFTGEVM
jgi:translation initiation factor 5B